MGALMCHQHHSWDDADQAYRTPQKNVRLSQYKSISSVFRRQAPVAHPIISAPDIKDISEPKLKPSSPNEADQPPNLSPLPVSEHRFVRKWIGKERSKTPSSERRSRRFSERWSLRRDDPEERLDTLEFKAAFVHGRKSWNRDRGDSAYSSIRVPEEMPGRVSHQWYRELNGNSNHDESFTVKDPEWFAGEGSVRNLVRRFEQDRKIPMPRQQRPRAFVSAPVIGRFDKPKPDTQRAVPVKDRASAPALTTSGSDSIDSSSPSKQSNVVIPVQVRLHPTAPDPVSAFECIPPPPEFSAGYKPVEPTAPPLTAPNPSAPTEELKTSRFRVPSPSLPPPPSDWLNERLQESTSLSPEDDSSPMPNSDSLSSPDQAIVKRTTVREVAKETYYMAEGEADAESFINRSPMKSKRPAKLTGLDAVMDRIADRRKLDLLMSPSSPAINGGRPGIYRAVLSRSAEKCLQREFAWKQPHVNELDVVEEEDSKELDECDRSYLKYQKEVQAILKNGDQQVTYSPVRIPKVAFPFSEHEKREPVRKGSEERKPRVAERREVGCQFEDRWTSLETRRETLPEFERKLPLKPNVGSKPQQRPAFERKLPIAASTPKEDVLVPSRAGHRGQKLDSELRGTKKALRFDSDVSGSGGSSSDLISSEEHKHPKQPVHYSSSRPGRLEHVTADPEQVVFVVNSKKGYEYRSTISLRTSDPTRYTVTQTKKELRSGKTVSTRQDVFGSGVTQCIVLGSASRRPFHGNDQLEDTLQSVVYDFQSGSGDSDF